MGKAVVITLGFALLGYTAPATWAAETCPQELAEAKAALKSAQASLKKSQVDKAREVQPPRSQAGARAQDVQAPRAQDVQAPRSQDVQAPRVDKGAALIRQADAACKKGDMSTASQKANEALAVLK